MLGRVGVWSMFLKGLKVVVYSLPIMLPVVLLNGLVYGWLDHQLGGLIESMQKDPSIAQYYGQVFGVVALMLGAYTGLQVVKRATATWASWIPCLFLPSVVFVALCAGSFTGEYSQQELILSMGLRVALELAWMCSVGGIIYGLWVCLAYNMMTSGRLDVLGAFQRLKATRLSYLAPHGGSTLLIYLGMQVVLPGVFYAVLYSFVDQSAILKPEASPFKQSAAVSTGLRRPIVLLFLITLLPAIMSRIFVTVWVEEFFHGLGWTQVFVTDSGAFDSSAAWGNVVAMFFGAPWAGAFYSEGIALGVASLLTGISAAGLTWAYLSRTAEPAT